MNRFFSNSAHMQILAVTPLEEMAIAETIEMTEALTREFQLRCGTLILNLVSPLVTATNEEVAGLKAGPIRPCAPLRDRTARPSASAVRGAYPPSGAQVSVPVSVTGMAILICSLKRSVARSAWN